MLEGETEIQRGWEWCRSKGDTGLCLPLSSMPPSPPGKPWHKEVDGHPAQSEQKLGPGESGSHGSKWMEQRAY